MSADAKVWSDDGEASRGSVWWYGLHDGPCQTSEEMHRQGELSLVQVLQSIETCLGGECRWQIRQYPGDVFGLVGYR